MKPYSQIIKTFQSFPVFYLRLRDTHSEEHDCIPVGRDGNSRGQLQYGLLCVNFPATVICFPGDWMSGSVESKDGGYVSETRIRMDTLF